MASRTHRGRRTAQRSASQGCNSPLERHFLRGNSASSHVVAACRHRGFRMAKALNRVMARHGSVFRERYHAHVLRSPTEVARAVAYVLGNYFHHAASWGESIAREIVDPYSSAAEHEKGWTGVDPPLVGERRTWLGRVGGGRRGAAR